MTWSYTWVAEDQTRG